MATTKIFCVIILLSETPALLTARQIIAETVAQESSLCKLTTSDKPGGLAKRECEPTPITGYDNVIRVFDIKLSNLLPYENVSMLNTTHDIMYEPSVDLNCTISGAALDDIKLLWLESGKEVPQPGMIFKGAERAQVGFTAKYNSSDTYVCKIINDVGMTQPYYIEVIIEEKAQVTIEELLMELVQEIIPCKLDPLGKPGEPVRFDCEFAPTNDNFDIIKESMQTNLLPLLNTTTANENALVEEYFNYILNNAKMLITIRQKNGTQVQSRMVVTQYNINKNYVINNKVYNNATLQVNNTMGTV